jgi:hypothetical protein
MQTCKSLLYSTSVNPSRSTPNANEPSRTTLGYISNSAENRQHRPERATKSSLFPVLLVMSLANSRAIARFLEDPVGLPMLVSSSYSLVNFKVCPYRCQPRLRKVIRTSIVEKNIFSNRRVNFIAISRAKTRSEAFNQLSKLSVQAMCRQKKGSSRVRVPLCQRDSVPRRPFRDNDVD